MVIIFVVGLTIPKDVFHFVIYFSTFIHHYNHHNEEHGDLSLAEYFGDHFGGVREHDREHPDHEKHPLSHEHTSDCNYSSSFISYFHKLSFTTQTPVSTTVIIATNNLFYSSDFSQSIWQPPRFC